MPRISKKLKRRRRPTDYTPRHYQELSTGNVDFFGDLFDGDLYPTKIEAWSDLKDEILPDWIAEHAGSRPSAWWLFDAPGRRERTDGGIHPFDRPGYPEHLKKLAFGKPACHATREDFLAEFEDEEDFLRRHGLLEPSEM